MRLNPGGPVVSAVYSPDGRRILTASKNSSVRVWRADDGRSTVTLQTTGDVHDAEFRPDGREVLTSSFVGDTNTGYVELWDLRDGRRVGRWTHPDDGASASYSIDGRFILTLGFLRPAVLRQMVTDQRNGRRDQSKQLWQLLSMELWYRGARAGGVRAA